MTVHELEAQVLGHIRAGIAARLGREPEDIAPDRSFTELGLDSVLLLELSAKLTERFGAPLADFAAFDHPTPAELARHIADLLTRPAATPEPEPTKNAETPASGLELPPWSSKSGT